MKRVARLRQGLTLCGSDNRRYTGPAAGPAAQDAAGSRWRLKA